MNRPNQIRQVYAELRASLGPSVSAHIALELAESIVDLFSIDEEQGGPVFDIRIGGLPFHQWSVDVAMADGGWRLLGYELSQARAIEEQEEWEMVVHRGFKQINEGAYA
jgi:hypothetical protein